VQVSSLKWVEEASAELDYKLRTAQSQLAQARRDREARDPRSSYRHY
jgi:hypothetical protein